MEGKIKIGPTGNKGYKSPTMVNWDEGSHNGILSHIFLSHGSNGIYSIQFQFMLDDKLVLSDHHGQNTGNVFDVISLNWPREYITGISGVYNNDGGKPNLKSLKIFTNTKEYGFFGSSKSSYDDEKFGFELGKFCQFGGFYGTYDASGLQCIGVYLQPTTGTTKTEETESKQRKQKKLYNMFLF